MVERVELIQPGAAGFDAALESILGRPPDPYPHARTSVFRDRAQS